MFTPEMLKRVIANIPEEREQLKEEIHDAAHELDIWHDFCEDVFHQNAIDEEENVYLHPYDYTCAVLRLGIELGRDLAVAEALQEQR